MNIYYALVTRKTLVKNKDGETKNLVNTSQIYPFVKFISCKDGIYTFLLFLVFRPTVKSLIAKITLLQPSL
jgi:hypothetical protein